MDNERIYQRANELTTVQTSEGYEQLSKSNERTNEGKDHLLVQ